MNLPDSIIHQPIVLVLNRAWQAINVRTVGLAVQQVMAGNATPLDVAPDGAMIPVRSWQDWVALPIRPQDRAIGTVRGPIRAPTVIVCVGYDKVPRRRPSFSARAVRQRDGNRCQYTGRLLSPQEGSLDHVMPRSRGGANTFENVVLACRKVNGRKANPHPRGSRPAPALDAQGPARAAGDAADPQRPRRAGLGAVPGDEVGRVALNAPSGGVVPTLDS